MTTIQFRGKPIPVTCANPPDIQLAIGTDLFQNWLAHLDPSLDLQAVEVQSLDKFGSSRVGFLKISTTTIRNGVKIPGIVLLRGSAVAVLLILTDESTKEQWTILTEQPRVPTGKLLLEIPAGMSDGSGNLRGVAIQELQEECGLVATPEDLIDLVELAFGGQQPGVYMSPGLLDEFIGLYLWRITFSSQRIAELEGKLGGADPHEQIRLRLVKLNELWRTAADGKTLSALALYQGLKETGKL
jgi:ADP-sugar diphosphatase